MATHGRLPGAGAAMATHGRTSARRWLPTAAPHGDGYPRPRHPCARPGAEPRGRKAPRGRRWQPGRPACPGQVVCCTGTSLSGRLSARTANSRGRWSGQPTAPGADIGMGRWARGGLRGRMGGLARGRQRSRGGGLRRRMGGPVCHMARVGEQRPHLSCGPSVMWRPKTGFAHLDLRDEPEGCEANEV